MVGYLNFLISGDGGLLLVSQACIGFGIGALLFPAIRLGKCRNPKVAALAGILAALVAYGAYYGSMMANERAQWVDGFTQMMKVTRKMPEPQARAYVEKRLSPLRYAKFWFADRARAGVTLTDSDSSHVAGRPSSSGTRLTGFGFWALLGGEIALASFFALMIPAGVAANRYSEEFDAWYKKRGLYQVHPSHLPGLLQAAQTGDWKAAGAIGKGSKTGGNIGGYLHLYEVPGQDGGIASISRNAGNNQTQVLLEKPVSGEEARQLRGLA